MDFGLARRGSTATASLDPDAGGAARRRVVAARCDAAEHSSTAVIDPEATQNLNASTHSTAPGTPTAIDKLTRTGTLMGTPAYMSPEQFRGRYADARSDQFSFCVALYEALFEARPFGGRIVHRAGRARRRRPPHRAARVRDDSLLAAGRAQARAVGEARGPLPVDERSPRGARSAAGRGPDRLRQRRGRPPGRDLDAAGHRGWRDRRPDRPATREGRGARTRSSRPARPTPRPRSTGPASLLDRYVERWAALYVEACEATHVRGEQSTEVLDLRIECLMEGLRDLTALCRLFRSATAEVVENAVSAAMALPPPERCRNIELLRAVVRPPADAEPRRPP